MESNGCDNDNFVCVCEIPYMKLDARAQAL